MFGSKYEVMSEQYYDDTLWEVQDRYLIIFNIFSCATAVV